MYLGRKMTDHGLVIQTSRDETETLCIAWAKTALAQPDWKSQLSCGKATLLSEKGDQRSGGCRQGPNAAAAKLSFA